MSNKGGVAHSVGTVSDRTVKAGPAEKGRASDVHTNKTSLVIQLTQKTGEKH